MEKIKDFFYYISDLLVALVIVIIIALSFYFNIRVFFVDVFSHKKEVSISQDIVENSNTNKTDDKDSNKSVKTEDISITIPEKAIPSKVVDILYDNYLVKSKDEAMDYILANNLEGKIKSGTFTLNTSMSMREVFNSIS